jgi:transcriptional regulator with XRE-family HTH domain
MNPPKKQRKDLTYSDKKKILALADENKKLTQQDIASFLGCNRSTVSRVLKDRSKIEGLDADDANRRRIKGCKNEELENVLAEWIRLKRGLKQTIPSTLVREQARSLAESLEITDFKFSDGWLFNFFKRHDFSNVHLHGEGGSANEEQVQAARLRLQEKLCNFSPHNIYNADETGLYYKLLPKRSVVLNSELGSVRGTKIFKDRLTILLCTNATGTNKIVPWVVGHAANPRCLKGKSNLPVKYCSSKNGWMTHEIMSLFLISLDDSLKCPSILLLDNFSGHQKALEGVTLRNLTIEFLPPNTTSHLQPLDGGVIESFKAHYRRSLAHKVLSDDIELRNVDLMQAFVMLANAWSHVTPLTIANCWQKTGIVPKLRTPEGYADPIHSELSAVLAEFEGSLTAGEINQIDDMLDSTLPVPDATEILTERGSADQGAAENGKANAPESVDAAIMSRHGKYLNEACDAKKCCECLEYAACYQFQNAGLYTEEERKLLYELMEKTMAIKRKQGRRQGKITDFARPDDVDVFVE